MGSVYPPSSFLKVKGTQVVDSKGSPVILRGAGLGGWLNMENFITGFPGHEAQHRAAMRKALGAEKYEFFFDKWLEYFFTEADAKYFASLGLNCIRIPFNFRHFEDDMNPRVLKLEGFKHLDRVIDICAREGIYTILDMHTLPGGHNQSWHSDNPTPYAAFWDFKDHQDRTVWLWEQIAARYRHNPWIAGYNPINEPADCQHTRLPLFYNRLEKAIRAVDPDHILWLDGNTYAMEFSGFDDILPNCVYALHDYSTMGFPDGVPYIGSGEQKQILAKQYARKAEFQHRNNTAIWNGEFGPVYAAPDEAGADQTNQRRYNLLSEQLRIYDAQQIPWTIWLYKDIGLQGMVHTSADSAWNKLTLSFVEKKRALQLDRWGKFPCVEVDSLIDPLAEWIDRVSPGGFPYPFSWDTRRHVERAVLQTLLSDSLQDEFAGLFKEKSLEELDALARSFHFEECKQREGLNRIMREHAKCISI